jgi:hypothetical protein
LAGAIFHCPRPRFGGYVLLVEGLCTTGSEEGALRQVFVDGFSFGSQIPVLPVFYLCEQKMTSAVNGLKQPWILDPR